MEQRVSASGRNYWTTADIRSRIEKKKLVVFGKGTSERPACGFSERVYTELRNSGHEFEEVDVISDSSIQAALSVYSGTTELPLVFVDGRMYTCSDSAIHSCEFKKLRDDLRK